MRYLFVDRIISMEVGKSVQAIKNITATEDVFNDHFPRFPLYPGALLIETMAQTAGLLIEKECLITFLSGLMYSSLRSGCCCTLLTSVD